MADTRVIVDGKYTFITNEKVSVGDKVILPTPYFLRDVKGPTWEGNVTSLQGDPKADCVRIISVVRKK